MEHEVNRLVVGLQPQLLGDVHLGVAEDGRGELHVAGGVHAVRQGLTLVPISAQLELTLPLSAQLKLSLSPI